MTGYRRKLKKIKQRVKQTHMFKIWLDSIREKGRRSWSFSALLFLINMLVRKFVE